MMTGATSGSAQSGSRLSAVMDGLVSDARSERDQVFNTLDAVDRRTKLSSESLARQVQRFLAEQAAATRAERDADPGAARPEQSERDARFDPEDEWELRTSDAVAGGAAAAAGRAVDQTADETADDDEYPETWLR
jgi:hypothetical protein